MAIVIKDIIKKQVEFYRSQNFDFYEWHKENVEMQNEREIGIIPRRLQYGKLHYFQYIDPKTDDKMAFWNEDPVVIKIGEGKSKEGPIDIGINLNFFPEEIKVEFLNAFWESYKKFYDWSADTPALDQKELKLDADLIMKQFKDFGVGFCVRQYIVKRIVEPYVFDNRAESWSRSTFCIGDMTMSLKNTKGLKTVPSRAQIDKLFYEYIKKTR